MDSFQIQNFQLSSSSVGTGSVEDIFPSPIEPALINFILLLPDVSVSARFHPINETFVLRSNVLSLSFGFIYTPSEEEGIRSIYSVSVTRGTILGGTAIVATLSGFPHFSPLEMVQTGILIVSFGPQLATISRIRQYSPTSPNLLTIDFVAPPAPGDVKYVQNKYEILINYQSAGRLQGNITVSIRLASESEELAANFKYTYTQAFIQVIFSAFSVPVSC